MSSTDSVILKFLGGKPVIWQDVCLIYSPTLGEIRDIGLDQFYKYLSVIQIEKPSDIKEDTEEGRLLKELLSKISEFEYMIFIAQEDIKFAELEKKAFNFFIHEDIQIIENPPSIVIGDPAERRVITKDNFDEFKYYISLGCALIDVSEEQIVILPTDSESTKEIKRKLIEGRRAREKAKKKKQGNKNSDIKFSDLVGSLATGSSSLNILNIWELTYYAFQDQLKRMSWQEEFDINTRAAIGGAKISKEKLQHWIKTMTFK